MIVCQYSKQHRRLLVLLFIIKMQGTECHLLAFHAKNEDGDIIIVDTFKNNQEILLDPADFALHLNNQKTIEWLPFLRHRIMAHTMTAKPIEFLELYYTCTMIQFLIIISIFGALHNGFY